MAHCVDCERFRYQHPYFCYQYGSLLKNASLGTCDIYCKRNYSHCCVDSACLECECVDCPPLY